MTPAIGQLWQLLSPASTIWRLRVLSIIATRAHCQIVGHIDGATADVAIDVLARGKRCARLLENADGTPYRPRRRGEDRTASELARVKVPRGMSEDERVAYDAGRWP